MSFPSLRSRFVRTLPSSCRREKFCILVYLTLLYTLTIVGLPSKVGYSQVVQLPTMHTFSLSGGAMVPDGGSASLGGINRSASSSTRTRGLPTNQQTGQSRSSTQASMSATIIDLDALDRELRTQAAPSVRNGNGVQPGANGNSLERENDAAREMLSRSSTHQHAYGRTAGKFNQRRA